MKTEHCLGCPLEDVKGFNCTDLERNYPEDAVMNVEKWSVEHLPKTRLQDLLEKYPNADKESVTYLACCRVLGYCKECPNLICEKCWNQPLEEE